MCFILTCFNIKHCEGYTIRGRDLFCVSSIPKPWKCNAFKKPKQLSLSFYIKSVGVRYSILIPFFRGPLEAPPSDLWTCIAKATSLTRTLPIMPSPPVWCPVIVWCIAMKECIQETLTGTLTRVHLIFDHLHVLPSVFIFKKRTESCGHKLITLKTTRLQKFQALQAFGTCHIGSSLEKGQATSGMNRRIDLLYNSWKPQILDNAAWLDKYPICSPVICYPGALWHAPWKFMVQDSWVSFTHAHS